jgi:hypothetical protein
MLMHFLFQVMFPSTLIGSGENWTMMKTISVTEYLNYEAGLSTMFHRHNLANMQYLVNFHAFKRKLIG